MQKLLFRFILKIFLSIDNDLFMVIALFFYSTATFPAQLGSFCNNPFRMGNTFNDINKWL